MFTEEIFVTANKIKQAHNGIPLITKGGQAKDNTQHCYTSKTLSKKSQAHKIT